MPEITQCPECERKLNVPDGQLGSAVRCPACGATFTAERYAPPQRRAVEPEPEPEPPPRPRDYDDRGSGRRRYDDRDDYRDDDYPRRRRPYYRREYGRYYGRTNRSSTIQTLGILSLCFCWTWVPCWIMGIMALVMASQDLSAMDGGSIDDSGRGAIKTGQICAIIGLCASVLLLFSCCGIQIMAGALR